MKSNDNPKLGLLLGFALPLISLTVFSLASLNRFDSIQHMISHFQTFNIWYKVLSLSLMPGAGLFFLWNKNGKLNQARSVLLMTMFYGIFVLILYFSN